MDLGNQRNDFVIKFDKVSQVENITITSDNGALSGNTLGFLGDAWNDLSLLDMASNGYSFYEIIADGHDLEFSMVEGAHHRDKFFIHGSADVIKAPSFRLEQNHFFFNDANRVEADGEQAFRGRTVDREFEFVGSSADDYYARGRTNDNKEIYNINIDGGAGEDEVFFSVQTGSSIVDITGSNFTDETVSYGGMQ